MITWTAATKCASSRTYITAMANIVESKPTAEYTGFLAPTIDIAPASATAAKMRKTIASTIGIVLRGVVACRFFIR
jgi:hypothetical protein